jgi:hypothetical protein
MQNADDGQLIRVLLIEKHVGARELPAISLTQRSGIQPDFRARCQLPSGFFEHSDITVGLLDSSSFGRIVVNFA